MNLLFLLKDKIVWIAIALGGLFGYMFLLKKDIEISELKNDVQSAEIDYETEKVNSEVKIKAKDKEIKIKENDIEIKAKELKNFEDSIEFKKIIKAKLDNMEKGQTVDFKI